MSPRARFLAADGAPLGEADVPAGGWLTAAAVRAGVAIVHDCDGQGVCGTCRVRIESGPASPPDREERTQLGAAIREGWRLCCRVRLEGDVAVRLPPPDFAYPPGLQRE